MRRLGEEIYGSGSAAHKQATCLNTESCQSSDGQFFHSSDLHVRILSTLIILRTINQGVCMVHQWKQSLTKNYLRNCNRFSY